MAVKLQAEAKGDARKGDSASGRDRRSTERPSLRSPALRSPSIARSVDRARVRASAFAQTVKYPRHASGERRIYPVERICSSRYQGRGE